MQGLRQSRCSESESRPRTQGQLNSAAWVSEVRQIWQIVAGTLSLDYWDELAGPPECQLSFGIDEAATAIDLSPAGLAQPGALVQVDGEILRVNAVLNGGGRYEVTRGVYGSGTSVHQAQSAVFHLQRKVAIVPFVRGFFGSPASGSWSFLFRCPMRVWREPRFS